VKWLNLIRSAFETAMRLIIFTFPVSLVAKWCDVPPSWKSAAFVAFCIVWSGVVFAAKDDSATQDDQPVVEKPKRTVALLTRAELVSEARKSTRASKQNV
jgi:hypothetical protein